METDSLRGAVGRVKQKALSRVALFDVCYKVGTVTSNRKVLMHELTGLDGEKRIQAVIEAQDEEIAKRSGKSRAPIKSIKRAKAKQGR